MSMGYNYLLRDTLFKKRSELKEKLDGRENDFVYIHAWNEWGEGAMLEPDEQEKFGYLQAIKNVVL